MLHRIVWLLLLLFAPAMARAEESQPHVHDLNATLLNQLGVDHTRLTFRFQGRDYRRTDVE
jgi:hypothetical protein